MAREGKKNTLTYVNWTCGLGKTTYMLELGHILGLISRPPKGTGTITVRLVLAYADLVGHYEQYFA